MWLVNLLDDFFAYLKENNFHITITQKKDVYLALSLLDITEKKQVFSALQCILVTHLLERYKFQDLLDNFFNIHVKKDHHIIHKESENSSTGLLKSTLSSYRFQKYNYGATLKYFILNQQEKQDRLIRLAVSNIDSIQSTGHAFHQAQSRLHLPSIEEELLTFKKELQNKGASLQEIELILEKIRENLKTFKKKIRRTIKEKQREQEQKQKQKEQPLVIENLHQEELETIAKRLAQKLQKKKQKRYKKAYSGSLHIHKTIHKSMHYDLVPIHRIYKKKRRKKRRLLLLTDLSDSVRKYAQMVLLLLYQLHHFFKDIQVLSFIADAQDITALFKASTCFSDLIKATQQYGGNSDYNNSLNTLLYDYQESLTQNTTLIIIGDARNNYISPDLNTLLSIENKVKEIIWLNPDPQELWNTSDSNMELYQKIISKHYSIRTIQDIQFFSEDILFK